MVQKGCGLSSFLEYSSGDSTDSYTVNKKKSGDRTLEFECLITKISCVGFCDGSYQINLKYQISGVKFAVSYTVDILCRIT